MKLSFHGAARTVTGTKHLLTLDNGKKYLLDCGMFQGMGAETDALNNEFGFDAKGVYCVFLSHAHIDHSGLIPKLVKEGFTGKIYSTQATKDLSEILLYDSAEIQVSEADYMNKRRGATNGEACHALYTVDDVVAAMSLFETIEYNEWVKIDEDVEVMYSNAGHLIGSAAINIRATENGKTTAITFSGDVGRYRSALLQPPAEFPQADYVILESTYGDKMHDIAFSTIENLEKWIKRICIKRGGKLIIPAFSVGRTQEILYSLNQLELEHRLPELNYFVDSPLGTKATEVIKSYKNDYNDRLQNILKIDEDPFLFKGLKYVDTADDSKQLVEYKEPCVIISSSGTADAGRVKHHIFSCIDGEANAVLMSGYCQPSSLGGRLLNGAQQVEIFGDTCNVKAEVGQIKSMSAHGDSDDLCRFVGCQDTEKVKTVFLVHGEYLAQQELAARLNRKGFEKVEMPSMHQEFILE
ncbi:MBL fold metallo-hydrolase RNA specificity domain-containing protein [Segetibacter koreensis]|uniref:MBL fold metallo-hydrolase RNA specificity domain-containing protein n=1 Tax=Segetibacter koreensis TaxID=398037 RepID=UPI00037CD43A|nr:MBL fold metallo-hydrolase [Segetibacter koreensis]